MRLSLHPPLRLWLRLRLLQVQLLLPPLLQHLLPLRLPRLLPQLLQPLRPLLVLQLALLPLLLLLPLSEPSKRLPRRREAAAVNQ